MAASNDSQGLKIAVAVFIALSVILAVTSYFLYSNGAVAEARLAQATEKNNELNRANGNVLSLNEDLRGKIGVRNAEADAVKTEIDAEYKKVTERLDQLGNQVQAA